MSKSAFRLYGECVAILLDVYFEHNEFFDLFSLKSINISMCSFTQLNWNEMVK